MGQEQGVRVDDEFVSRAMAARVGSIQGGDKVFPFNSEQYRRCWRQAQARLGLEWVGPPHTLRHTGPSCDAASGRRDLEQIRRRWSQMKSEQRNNEQHALTTHLSRLPRDIKVQGRRPMDDFAVPFMKYVPPEIRCAFEAELAPMLRREPLSGGRTMPPAARAVGLSRGGNGETVQRLGVF